MAYNSKNYHRLMAEFAAKKRNAEMEAESRTAQLHEKIPDLRMIDSALSRTGYRVMREAGLGGDDLAQRIENIKKENKQLQSDRIQCLVYNGYPEDYTDVHYECSTCRDSGFVGTKMCSCFREALIYAGYESSGIGKLISEQSFDTFSLDYYKDDAKNYSNAQSVLSKCIDYSRGDSVREGENLLMIGNTGLGKTHLSTSVAKGLIEAGLDVVYETAQNIFADFENERFRGYGYSEEDRETDKYFDCDLLIIDDLGTESTNQFTVATLYNIINTRLNHKKSIMINTNLVRDELRRRYADRITSRLFGEFTVLIMMGQDVRSQKLKK